MEWKHGHFDGEPDKERPKYPLLNSQRQIQLHQIGDLERVSSELLMIVEVQRQNAEQHEHRAGQCIEEELDGRVKLSGSAPDADDEVHQHQHPEYVEQEEVERDKDADHSRLEQQEHGVVFFYAILNAVPR